MNATIDFLEGFWCEVKDQSLILLSDLPWSKGILKDVMIMDKSFCVKNTSPITIKLIGIDFLFWLGIHPGKFNRKFSVFHGIAGADRKLKRELKEEKFTFQMETPSDWNPFQGFPKKFLMILNPGEFFVMLIPALYPRFLMTLRISDLKPLIFNKKSESQDEDEDNIIILPVIPKVPFDWKNFLKYMAISLVIAAISFALYKRVQKFRSELVIKA